MADIRHIDKPRKVIVDGVPIPCVRKVTTIIEVGELPIVRIDIVTDTTNIDADGNIIVTTVQSRIRNG